MHLFGSALNWYTEGYISQLRIQLVSENINIMIWGQEMIFYL